MHMCVNFKTPTPAAMIEVFSAPVYEQEEWPAEVWQDYPAPIIRGNGKTREGSLATYGMVPQKRIPDKVRKYSTMNARSETVGIKRSYSKQWNEGQLCLVPLLHFYEPNYESGKAERWKIGMADGAMFAVAGLWKNWYDEEGKKIAQSFTQLTVNSDDHELMRRFHKPGDEKRSLIIVPRAEWDNWLGCRNPEEARSFFGLYPANLMMAEPAPTIAAKKKKQTESSSLF